ncbi:MAG: PEP-CTERM sorting domain-containing protein [Pseudomonadota bacterium]
MKLKHLPIALLAAASSLACAQTQYRVHETFLEGNIFDGLITFSQDYQTILAVTGELISPNESPLPKAVDGVEGLSYTTLRPFTRQVSLTGPEGYPWGYMLSFSWEYQSSPTLTLPVFVTHTFLDAGTGITQSYYNNSINGLNYATSTSIMAVPEPATYAMLVAGLGALALMRRRKTS